MNDYIKYDELKEKVDKFKLTELGIDSKVRNDFYAHYNDLQVIREIENANGSLTSEEQAKKEAYMQAIDHWIASFIEERKTNVRERVAEFDDAIAWLLDKLKELKAMFTLNDIVVEDVNQIVQGIENEFQALIGQASELRDEFDKLKELAQGYTEGLDFTTTYVEIMSKLKNLRNLIKEIKKDQIAKYNANVISTNAAIEKIKGEFANKEGLSEDVLTDLAKLETLEQCTYSLDGKAYNNRIYMNYLDYDKLKQMLLLLNQIQVKTKTVSPTSEIDLESDMKYIEDKLVEIEGKIKDEMTMEEIKPLLEELSHVSGKIDEFEIKLKENKDKISEEEYNNYLKRIDAARNKLEELRKKLFERIPNLYKALSEELESLNKDVSHLEFYVEALFGQITKKGLSVYEERLGFYEGELNKIKSNIEKAKESGKLDDNQYAKLQEKVEKIEKKIEKIRSKVKDPEIVAKIEEMDIFTFFNGQIDGIEKSIDALETMIDGLEKPIKDRKVRKEIDKKFVAIEQEIKDVEKFLEKYKDQDPEKYEAAKERLEGLKERLDKVGKKYRKKCPLLVRAVKSAKEFYKKHKKMCLVIAGLAAIALVHATVGPILIPAIMHGNLMIGFHAPALRGFVGFVNNILGGMINANVVGNVWTLANGVPINPAVASSSLLKGLAISGLGSAAILAPMTAGVVMAVKKLNEKMKAKELKNKLNVKDKLQKGKEKLGEKIENIKNKKKNKTDKEFLNEISILLKDFQKSGMSFEEYCENNELTEEQKVILQSFVDKAREEEKNKEAGKGRK